MSRTEEVMGRAGPLVALGAASALLLVLFPASAPVLLLFPTHAAAVERRYVLTLPLFVAFLIGCAAVPFSPAHRAAAASREILVVPWHAGTGLRWVGFTGMVFCAVYVIGDVPAVAKVELSVDKVNGLLPFLMLLAGVLAVNQSMLTAWGSDPAPPPEAGAVAGGDPETPSGGSWKKYWEALLGGLRLLSPRSPHPSSLRAPRGRHRSSLPRAEEAMRRAGALVGLAAVSALALVLFPAPAAIESRYAVLVLALFVSLLLGCAAVLLSPAHRGVAQLARRAVEIFAVPWRGATDLRWAGFTGMLIYAVYAIGDVRKPPPVSAGMVNGLLPFLVFLAGAFTVNLSMLTGRSSDPPPAAEE